jgi:hypothetical protein
MAQQVSREAYKEAVVTALYYAAKLEAVEHQEEYTSTPIELEDVLSEVLGDLSVKLNDTEKQEVLLRVAGGLREQGFKVN